MIKVIHSEELHLEEEEVAIKRGTIKIKISINKDQDTFNKDNLVLRNKAGDHQETLLKI